MSLSLLVLAESFEPFILPHLADQRAINILRGGKRSGGILRRQSDPRVEPFLFLSGDTVRAGWRLLAPKLEVR